MNNLAEVHRKLVDRGLRTDDAREAALSPSREAVSFTPGACPARRRLGETNSSLRLVVRRSRVSGLGDRMEGSWI
jgi:hypothetical protein